MNKFASTLAETEPTVVHFSGYGSQASLIFPGPAGNAQAGSPQQLSSVLNVASTHNLQGIVLNISGTIEAFKQHATDISLPALVIEGGLPNYPTNTFVREFYKRLVYGQDFRDVFQNAKRSMLNIDLDVTIYLKMALIDGLVQVAT